MSKLHHDFPLGKVFEFKAIKQAKSQKDIPTDDSGVPYVVQSTVNNMVARFVNKQHLIDNDEAPVSGNAIVLGVTLPAVSYQKNEFGASQVITARSEHLDEKTGIYLVGVLSKYMEQFSYQRKPGMAIYKAMKVSFPVIENPDSDHEYTVDDIDWQYMRERIAELERERIAELERERIAELDAYLKVTGLDNYELTIDEEMALKGFFDGTITFKDFYVKELFNIHPTASYKLTNEEIFNTAGDIPVLSNSSMNNGIGGHCGLLPTENGNIITFSDTTTGGDTMFYQERPFIGYPHVQGMYPIGFVLDRYKAEFLISAIRKATGTGFNYANKFRRDIVGNTSISLPVNSDGSINWLYIYIYTSSGKENNQETCCVETERNECLQKYRVKFSKFEVSDIYEAQKVQHKLDKSQTELKGSYPCFSSDTTNNGILGYTENPEFHITDKNKVYIIFGDHTRTFDIATTDFSVLDNVKVLKPVTNNIKALQYINSVWGKSIPNLGYARHWSVAKNCKLNLPIASDGSPNFDYMECYIRAIEKVVITDVVKYKDKLIETTKKVVGD